MVAPRPFFIGSPGWVRSSACIWLFSSTHNTSACSGGLRYNPTMSSNLSAKSGSLLTLKLSTRCGFRPLARQMRDTEAFEMPISRAMVRVDHCVALVGVLWVVFSINEVLEIDFERPGRGA